jgi:4-phospho-D-threonate 3-dehydrogenase / 4-phospho-D-erythronate 3-dehydrogenase
MKLPKIAITMGDPSGIGPEICLDILRDATLAGEVVPIVFGEASVLQRCAEATGKSFAVPVVSRLDLHAVEGPAVCEISSVGEQAFSVGMVEAVCGRAAYDYLVAAIDAAVLGEVDGLATAPIHKEALRLAGIPHPGHTEILAERTGTESYCMMLTAPSITCSLVTVHVGFHEVPELLSEDRIYEVICLTRAAMRRLRGQEPRLAVCGLNPHAGENGLFGRGEEARLILPAIEKARAEGALVEGPLPPDTAFREARRKLTDAYVCMYHDQGLIPLKALAFDEAVNLTLGLPIVRSSVDHGTAHDIAWTGKASSHSLREAVLTAARLARP